MRIELRSGPDSDAFSLSVIDDGVDTPAEISLDTPDSLGLRLVASLAGQLKARFVLDRGDGSAFRVQRAE